VTARRNALESLARDWISLWSAGGPLDRFDALHDESFVDRASAGRATGREAFRQGIVDLLVAFPDLETRTEQVVVDAGGDVMAIRWSASGTFRARYLGCEPTGARVRLRGIEIVRVRDGRIVERWGEWDGLDLLAQLRGGGPV
jgi:predicted ester cyclase